MMSLKHSIIPFPHTILFTLFLLAFEINKQKINNVILARDIILYPGCLVDLSSKRVLMYIHNQIEKRKSIFIV